jgi:hypothetical protein
MRKIRLLAALLACCTVTHADPPTVIRVIRNAVRSTNLGYAEARDAITVLAASSVTGPSETWSFEMLDSFASLEDLDKTLPMASSGAVPYSDDVLPPARTLIALYRANLSHRWDEAAKIIPKARYFLVSIYRIRPGAQAGFADLTRMRTSRFESINFDQPEIAYQIMSGMPSGTFLFITPLASLATFDEGLAKTPDGLREIAAEQKLAAEVEIGHETFLFRIDPSRSYVSDDFASADPEFWSSRPKSE